MLLLLFFPFVCLVYLCIDEARLLGGWRQVMV